MRAGGYGIAGWAVAGDVVIDMSRMREISIEAPVTGEDGTLQWTRLRDTPVQMSLDDVQAADVAPQTQQAASGPRARVPAEQAAATNKRRREESPVEIRHPDNGLDIHLRNYDAASNAVANFLRGPPLPPEDGEEPRQPPTNRRRVDSPSAADDEDVPHLAIPPLAERQVSNASSTSSEDHSASSGVGRTFSTSTDATSPTNTPTDGFSSAPNDFIPPSRSTTTASDPFGYMSLPTSTTPAPPPPAVYTGFRVFPSSTGPVNTFGRPVSFAPLSVPNIFSSTIPGARSFPQYGGPGTLGYIGGGPTSSGAGAGAQAAAATMTRARPVHAHAYVTIGAGMKQKEVDVFTASRPLPGVSSVNGEVEDGLVPYHVPS